MLSSHQEPESDLLFRVMLRRSGSLAMQVLTASKVCRRTGEDPARCIANADGCQRTVVPGMGALCSKHVNRRHKRETKEGGEGQGKKQKQSCE